MEKKAWEEQLSPFWSSIEFVQEMQEHITLVTPIVKEYMQTAQRETKGLQPPCTVPGVCVLLLLLHANCKFLTCCQSPYTITEQVDPVSY